jgi:hypothetical protein
MENDILGIEESELEKSWNHIIDNLQTDFYRFKEVFQSDEDRNEYLAVTTSLVEVAKETYKRTRSIDLVMDELAKYDVEKIISNL